MPALDWEKFRLLPGAPTVNWEQLCRAVVFRNFGSLGSFREVAQQPGVEFHLKLDTSSGTLGDPGRWWGWQCRWYDVQPGRQIGKRRRDDVVTAIRKTEEVLPKVTDWVLWTKRPLTPTDQKWFDGIESTMRLHLWNENHLDAHLVGDASILRETYFGDLVFTPGTLEKLRHSSLAPVRERWIPEVHISVDPEAEIRKILGEADYWPEIGCSVRKLRASIEELTPVVDEIERQQRPELAALLEDSEYLCTTLATVASALSDNELRRAINVSADAWKPQFSIARGRRLARALRRARSPSSLAVQAMLARYQDTLQLYWFFWRYLSTSLVAVIGPAHAGKTHLAAALTAAREGRPSGVYLEAWPLTRRGTFDELVTRLPGLAASSFIEILEAVEAAGERSGTRIPVVIDGLNESEDPANWKGELKRLKVALADFRHVVVVVTVRPSAAEIALPAGLPKFRCDGFSSLTLKAIRSYFAFYKIDPGNLRLPLRRFSDPLFLRIFCESTNPDRMVEVNLDEIPASLVGAFIEFRKTVADRIANRPGSVRRYPPDILKALDSIALSLWKTTRRATTFDKVRELIGDRSVDWTESLARALADEGILSREAEPGGDERSAFLFDAFAGFLIADALTRRMSQDDFQEWIHNDNTIARLGAEPQEAHPLAFDIRKALVSMVPRSLSSQLWQFLDGGLRREAIIDAADLEGSLLDDATSTEIGKVALLPPTNRYRDLFDRFREVLDDTDHPLNAEFLDQLLSSQSVSDRDVRWTEWVRASADQLLEDVLEFTEDWRQRENRTPEDRLRALWLKWLLSTTVRHLRDHATMALYWYGRFDRKTFFELVLSSLQTSDQYVPERMLAAAYGVVMAAPSDGRPGSNELAPFLSGLWEAFCDSKATNATDHWLMREYVEGIVEVTRRYYPDALERWSGGVQFAIPSGPLAASSAASRAVASASLTYGYYFETYTVPRLVGGRFSGGADSPEYREMMSRIRGRTWELGWRPERFGSIDRTLAESLYDERTRPDRTDTYTQKYGWIGFYEAAGRLQREGRLTIDPEDGRLSQIDIDPSFPAIPSPLDLALPEWVPDQPEDTQRWISGGQVIVPDSLLLTESLEGHVGPWVALSGYLRKEGPRAEREVFGFLRGILVRRDDEVALREALKAQPYPGNLWIPESPSAFYLFAGEMPWSERVGEGRALGGLQDLYSVAVRLANEREIAVEIPAHVYAWESYHSILNQAGDCPVPAMTFADTFDLRAVPASLDWCDSQGRRASITLSAPSDFAGGSLLYVREDLIRAYCDMNDYSLVWIVWGERQVNIDERPVEAPEWLSEAYANRSHIWRRVATLNEVATC